jgi:hypothetical protein
MISGSEGNIITKFNPIKKNRKPLDETLAGIVTNNTIEKAGFLFSWKMMSRSRDYKMSIYPAIGYIFVIIIVILLTGNKNNKGFENLLTDKSKLTSQLIIGVYVASFVLTAAITQMVYTEKYKAAWIYYTTPFIEPGQIISGGIKAVILQIHLLITLIYLIISIALIGYSIIPNIIFSVSSFVLKNLSIDSTVR